jgi:hypothetical protein
MRLPSVAIACLVTLGALAVAGAASDARSSATPAAESCSVSPMLPAPPSDRPKYVLSVRVEDGLTRASGTLRVSFKPEVATDRLVFRLRPNIPARAAKGTRLTVTHVTADGGRVATELTDPSTLVLRRALAAGERVVVSMRWTLRLPHQPGLTMRGDRRSARFGSFLPLLVWDGAGWATEPPPRRDRANGASPTADFEVRVVAPRRVRVLATGVEVRPGLWRAEAVRDFTLALGSFQVRTTTIRTPKPVRVTVALERGSKFTMREYLPDAVKAFRSYVARYSGYPWPAHTLVVMPDMDRAGPNGFVWPMLSFVGGTNLDLIAHETAHQWFYSLVGVNTARDPWLIEGLATWAETGPERSLSTFLATPIPAAVRDRIGEPMSFWDRFGFETIWPGLYVQPVQALSTLGEPKAVDCALRAYVVQNAYRTVVPRDLLAALTGFPDAEEKLRARGARF